MEGCQEMKKILAVLLAVSIFTTGCASTPANPVPIAQVGDETKPCDAIINEMQQMITAQDKAAADRDVEELVTEIFSWNKCGFRGHWSIFNSPIIFYGLRRHRFC